MTRRDYEREELAAIRLKCLEFAVSIAVKGDQVDFVIQNADRLFQYVQDWASVTSGCVNISDLVSDRNKKCQ